MKGRSLWAAASTLSSSGGNVMLIVAASLLAPDLETLAGFGVAQSLLILAFGTARAMFGEVLIVEAAQRTGRPSGTDGLGSLPATVVTGAVAGAIGLALLPLFPSYVRPFLVVAALGAPVILAQDTARYILFTNERHRRAALLDIGWAVATALGAVLSWQLGWGPIAVVTIWTFLGAAATVGADRAVPSAAARLGDGVAWLRAHRGHSSRMAVEAFAATAVVGLPPAVASLFAESDVAVAARVLFATFGLQQMVYAISLISIGLGGSAPWAAARRVSAFGAVTAAATTLVLVTVPDAWGEALFADGFATARSIAVWFGLGQIGAAFANGALVGLRMSAIVHRTALVRTICTVAATAAASLGGIVGGVEGYGVGLAAGFALYGAAMLVLLWASLQQSTELATSNLEATTR